MRESTLAGAARFAGALYGEQHAKKGEEIGVFSADVFESDDLIERIYTVYLTLLTERFDVASEGYERDMGAIGSAYMNGFYIPCTRRAALVGQVDILNDRLPEYAGLVDIAKDMVSFLSVTKEKPPTGVSAPPFHTTYRLTMMIKDDKKGGTISVHNRYMAISRDGHIVPCVNRGLLMNGWNAAGNGPLVTFTSAAINLNADARFLWNVQTSEATLGQKTRTPLMLGVSQEHVKSLFYARQAPVTETGRKRPILHWVEAHRRRLKAGIDIDIKQHLRGISEFEMAGLPFKITNPQKPGSAP